MFSATDVANFLACHHVMTLDRAEAAGLAKRPYFPDPGVDLLRELGAKHERAYLDYLTGAHGTVIGIPTDISLNEAAAQTIEAMQRGAGAVYQGVFQIGPWNGRPDFLVRVEKPSALGAWSYEPVETKLARSTKVGALIQLCFYSDLLSEIQKLQPKLMHIVLGTGTDSVSYPVQHFIAYFRRVKKDFDAAFNAARNTYPEPAQFCNVCSWDPICDKRRHDDDHLSLVANITGAQRKALCACNVTTVASLAEANVAALANVDGVRRPTLARLSDQARLLVEGRTQGRLVHEMLPIEANTGLCILPAPSPWDIFLDLEGDPYAFGQDLEYLIGFITLPERVGDEPKYESIWSFDPSEERDSFAKFIKFVTERWTGHPEMHIYHYASYEPTAIKRLAGRHGLGVDEVDQLLRAEVFVDLYRVVKQAIRASVESYSIKKIEGLYGFLRKDPPRVSVLALQTFGAALAMGTAHEAAGNLLPALEAYNRDDCLSASKLREWLEERRQEIEAKNGPLPRPAPKPGEPPDNLAQQLEQIRAVMERLLASFPEKEADWTPEQRAKWLLAQMLEYHRREDKSTWWEYFRQCDLSPDELVEDGSALGGLSYVGEVDRIKKSIVHRYSFPQQDHAIDRAKNVHDPRTKAGCGTKVSLDDQQTFIDLKRVASSEVPHPTALIPYDIVAKDSQRDSLLRIATWVADHDIVGAGTFQAARDLLLRQPPRISLADADPLLDEEGHMTRGAVQLVRFLCTEPTVLPLQGPPGSGKTYTGSRMIAEVIRNNGRVGITAVSHKVISNLLQDVCDYCRQSNIPLRAVQKPNEDDHCADPMVTQAKNNERVLDALSSRTAQLGAGTSWLWSRGDMHNSVDVLFVDEAGQMSLADVLAISPAATSIVLLGDPQQLDQPQKGVHPAGVDISALSHLLNGRATIEEGKGLFLKETYRLHPEICAFTSEMFYDSRLVARPENETQVVHSQGAISGTGLRFVGVEHSGNQTDSPEEVAKIAQLIAGLLDGNSAWTDKTDATKSFELKDILVVAPYNAQVSALKKGLPQGARVGTVDKFQGQQAPVVFFSMTTSTPEEAPRGINFLYSLNRLNVAISRAQCVAVIVASPALLQVECKTPHQMQLANALCRYLEMAQSIEA